MDQFGDELKKMLKAGIGAVAAGLEKSQDVIEDLAKKGEPLYEQAKTVVADAAGKVKQAVSDGIDAMNMKPQVEELIDSLRGMGAEAWKQVREAIDEFEAQAAEAEKAAKEAADAAQDILNNQEEQEASKPDEAVSPEADVEKAPAQESENATEPEE
jgi:polyhydroxyalkanoate synthesis regulator phasin